LVLIVLILRLSGLLLCSRITLPFPEVVGARRDLRQVRSGIGAVQARRGQDRPCQSPRLDPGESLRRPQAHVRRNLRRREGGPARRSSSAVQLQLRHRSTRLRRDHPRAAGLRSGFSGTFRFRVAGLGLSLLIIKCQSITAHVVIASPIA